MIGLPRIAGIALFVLHATAAWGATPVEEYCDVTASGRFTTGESFSGSFLNDGVDFVFDWRHSAPGYEFESTTADQSLSGCFRNGEVNADFSGTGTLNGVGGHTFEIHVVDNRPPPDSFVLTASIVRAPTRRSEGIAVFDPPRDVRIPSEIRVTSGASGAGWTKLHLDDLTCRYRGTGATYDFQRCTDPLGTSYVPGETVAVASARLRIQKADNAYDLTTVDVDIGTGEVAPGFQDEYRFDVVGPEGSYSFAGLLEDGDVTITLLGGVP